MLSKSLIKFIRSLQLSKFRRREKLFIIEGDKLVREALDPRSNPNFKIHSLYADKSWIDDNDTVLKRVKDNVHPVSLRELEQISNLTTPNQVLALIHHYYQPLQIKNLDEGLVLALDSVQDPGNIGTIIRLADWYG